MHSSHSPHALLDSLLTALVTETASLEHARAAQIVGEVLNLVTDERLEQQP